MQQDKRFAVLIDADNVSDKYIKVILDEISNEGIVTYKRIYGDFTKTNLNSWKSILLNHSITPMQQYNYTTGKSSTDSAMIIDAMDILYSGNVDGFCLVSSDSDFTRLAVRLRESGMYVIGMGERKTPNPFISACNSFKYLEIIGSSESNADNDDCEIDELNIEVIQRAVNEILTDISDDDGWVELSQIGNILAKRYPSFDVRHFHFKALTPFISSLKGLEVKSIPRRTNPSVKVNSVRIKK